ncbi:hypothetical protein [Celeribacter sp.]|uniref:hypothetical protein n=1 Tax=Celeribacter sp. TaxID=1890673 RepID=UPI003A958A96
MLNAQQRRRRQKNSDAAAQQAKEERPTLIEVLPMAQKVFLRPRHKAILLGFLLAVVLPLFVIAGYLYTRAADQYVSTIGFSVRAENAMPTSELVSSLIGTSTNGAQDSDILYKYLRSRDLVSQINDEIDLKSLYRKPSGDPIFTLGKNATIEDLTSYWSGMTRVSYDDNSGLIEAEIRSFSPEDSYLIARAVLDQATAKINELSEIARSDTIRFAKGDLDTATENLRAARQELTRFRVENRMVDPDADIQGQMGLLNSLQAQLAEEMISNDLIRLSTTRDNDPRLEQSNRRITIIRNRIEEERATLGSVSEANGPAYSQIVSEYEGLIVDREFAEQRYLAARANYDSAIAEAGRQSRYLAVYNEPAPAETSTQPDRLLIFVLAALFLTGIWALSSLISYSIKDRR